MLFLLSFALFLSYILLLTLNLLRVKIVMSRFIENNLNLYGAIDNVVNNVLNK